MYSRDWRSLLCVIVTILIALIAGGTAAHQRGFASAASVAEEAYFRIGFPPDDVAFAIMLADPVKIQEARDIANGVQVHKVRVMGTIIKAPAPYNPPWSYHLDPESIEFFEVAVEVCDAHPQYVEEHQDEVCGAFLPGCVWCPFGSVVIEEVHIAQVFLPLVLKIETMP